MTFSFAFVRELILNSRIVCNLFGCVVLKSVFAVWIVAVTESCKENSIKVEEATVTGFIISEQVDPF